MQKLISKSMLAFLFVKCTNISNVTLITILIDIILLAIHDSSTMCLNSTPNFQLQYIILFVAIKYYGILDRVLMPK